MNTQTKKSINISELKIGDIVKYQIEHGICGTNRSNFEIVKGKILEIRNEYGGFFQIENNNYGGGQISVKKEHIISKQTKDAEIMIDRENLTIKVIKSAAQARGFYETPFYDVNKEKPDYYDLFE